MNIRKMYSSKRLLELKNKISKIFLTIPNEDMFSEVLSAIREDFQSPFGYFGYMDINGDLVCPSMTRDIWDRCQVHQKDFVFSREKWERKDTIWGKSIAEKKLLFSNEARMVPEGHLPINKVIVVPIIFHEEVIGQIALANKQSDYDEEDVKLLEEIADFISPILNARMEKQRESRLRKKTEDSLREYQSKLKERVKELRCLYGISKLVDQPDITIEKLLKGTLDLIRSSFQYPNLIMVKITYGDKKCTSEEFFLSKYKLTSETDVNGSHLKIEVYYKEEREFLLEETELLREITTKLKLFVERLLTEEKLKESERKFRILNQGFLSFTDDPLKNIKKLVKTVKELLKADWAFYDKLIERNNKLLIHCYGLDENDSEITLLEDSDGVVCTDIIQQNRQDLVVIKNIDQTPYVETDDFIREKKIKMYIGSVVRLKNKPVADICVLYKENKPISEVDKTIMEILTQAASIEEDRLLEKEKLKQSQEKFEDFFNNATDSIYIVDMEGNILEANQTAMEKLGYTKEELLSFNLADIDHPKYQSKINETINQIRKRNTHTFETIHVKKDRTSFPVEINSRLIMYNEKEVIISIARDITKRKQAEKALKESEQKFRTIVEQSMLGIAILQDDVVKYVNEKCASLYGYSVDEILRWTGGEFIKIVDPEQREWVADQARRKQDGDEEVINHYTFKGVKKNGENIWIEQFSKTIYYKGSTADFVIQIDVTDKVEANRKLKESENQVREAYKRAEFYKDLFAHDINNILHNVKSSVELLDSMYQKNNFERHETLFNILKEQVIRGTNLVSNIRKLSKIEDTEKHVESIGLKEKLNEAIQFVKTSSTDENLEIDVSSTIKNPIVRANELLTDVFENILFNAVEYNQSVVKQIDIEISISTETDKDFIKIEFRDNGIGIPDQLKNRLFKEQIKYDRNTKGMGLGLLSSYKILNSYGGRIKVEDRIEGIPSKGSNIIILLPKA
ncbi:MAG: putative Histidine kinase [Promethearchaeota archaeon]|nr:MAG: putative Histidine kinase [Candidatus Lokiarchaeota archaeon]